MALTGTKHRTKAELAELAEHDRIAILVQAYEAEREIPGHARNVATSALGMALYRHDQPFVCGPWIYRWCREEDSISRLPYAGMHINSTNRRNGGVTT